MWLKFQWNSDHSMATNTTQKSPSPANLFFMKVLDAWKMGGGRLRHYLVISGSVGPGGGVRLKCGSNVNEIVIIAWQPILHRKAHHQLTWFSWALDARESGGWRLRHYLVISGTCLSTHHIHLDQTLTPSLSNPRYTVITHWPNCL